MTGTWNNADGLVVKYADYYKGNPDNYNNVSVVNTFGVEKELVISVDLTKIPTGTVSYTSDLNNDGTNDGFNTGDVGLPPYSSVVSAIFYGTEAAAGGTSFKVGNFLVDGTAVDDDGIVSATEGVTANIGVGKRIYGAGAYVSTTAGTASAGAAQSYIGITATGTFTAGKGLLRIRYISNQV
jgi:hypothetical protein